MFYEPVACYLPDTEAVPQGIIFSPLSQRVVALMLGLKSLEQLHVGYLPCLPGAICSGEDSCLHGSHWHSGHCCFVLVFPDTKGKMFYKGRGLDIYQMFENGNMNRNGKVPVIHCMFLRLNFKWLGTLFLRGRSSNQGRGFWAAVCFQKNRKRQLSFHYYTTSIAACQDFLQMRKVMFACWSQANQTFYCLVFIRSFPLIVLFCRKIPFLFLPRNSHTESMAITFKERPVLRCLQPCGKIW